MEKSKDYEYIGLNSIEDLKDLTDKELYNEYIQTEFAEHFDHVDMSLSTLKFRSDKLNEIEDIARKRRINFNEWEKSAEKRIKGVEEEMKKRGLL